MDLRTFVTRKTDVTQLALLFRCQRRFHSAINGENSVGIGVANYLVKLQKVHVVGLQPAQRFVYLLGRALFGAAVNLGHQESFLAVTILQRFAHADFAFAAVVVPAVVQEIDAFIEPGANDAYAFLHVTLPGEVISAEAYAGHFFAGVAERAVGDAVPHVSGRVGRRRVRVRMGVRSGVRQ